MKRMARALLVVVLSIFVAHTCISPVFADEQQEYGQEAMAAEITDTEDSQGQNGEEELAVEQADESYANAQEEEVQEVEEEPYDYDREIQEILSNQGIDSGETESGE